MRGLLLVTIALGGCARGELAGRDGEGRSDAGPRLDAIGADAPAVADSAAPPLDASMPDAAPDAAPDACVPVTTQLLVNAALDASPQGTGWAEQLIKAGYPLITPMDNPQGPTEHTAPFKAWLGGFTGAGVTDVLSQDVAIPPATSSLVLTGYHAVRTDEGGAAVRDTATVALALPSGGVIETALALSNLTPLAPWSPFSHAFAQIPSGQTVRLQLSSTNDAAYPTSFYFDTLALTATHGCP